MNLYLIRGLPGSGKSTLAKNIMKSNYDTMYSWFEADMFFEDDDGEYKFDGSKIRDAHQWCQKITLDRIQNGDYGDHSHVIVSNTFTQTWELDPYIKMGLLNGLVVVVIECLGEYQNVHGVPESKIVEMSKRWESNGKIRTQTPEYRMAQLQNRLYFRTHSGGESEFLTHAVSTL